MANKNIDYEAIKREFVSEGETIKALAEKYGVPTGAIYRKSSAEKWSVEKWSADRLRQRAEELLPTLDASFCSESELDTSAVKSILADGIESREKLCELRRISEVLTNKIRDAVNDELQFNRYVVTEKGTDEYGKAVSLTTEKCFDKMDTKAIKEMCSTLKVLSECVRSLYGIPTFGETTRLYLAEKSDEDSEDEPITVSFLDGEEFSE